MRDFTVGGGGAKWTHTEPRSCTKHNRVNACFHRSCQPSGRGYFRKHCLRWCQQNVVLSRNLEISHPQTFIIVIQPISSKVQFHEHLEMRSAASQILCLNSDQTFEFQAGSPRLEPRIMVFFERRLQTASSSRKKDTAPIARSGSKKGVGCKYDN